MAKQQTVLLFVAELCNARSLENIVDLQQADVGETASVQSPSSAGSGCRLTGDADSIRRHADVEADDCRAPHTAQ